MDEQDTRTADIHGRKYAVLSTLKPDDRLQADDGFDCIPEGSTLVVRADKKGELYVACHPEPESFWEKVREWFGMYHSRHYLEGQVNDVDRLIGLYKL